MGSIRGDLSVLGIANLLQTLTVNRSEGYLTVELAAHQKVLYVHPGGLRLVRGSRRCHRLEKLLRRVGPVASDGGSPGPGTIARLVREWLVEEIGDLLTWTRGTFRFQEAADLVPGTAGPQGLGGIETDACVTTLILEAARRVDDLPRIRATIPDLESVPERTDFAALVSDPGLDGEILGDVLPLVDGTRTVNRIVQASAFPRLSVLSVLHRLALRGAIAVRSSGGARVDPLPTVA